MSRNLILGFFVLILLANVRLVYAQETATPVSAKRNIISTNFGLFEIGLSYERNIAQKPAAQTHLKIGMGHGAYLSSGEGTYLNTSAVQLFGRNSSHLELNAGFIHMLTNSLDKPTFFDNHIPTAYAGYRYERTKGGFVFRLGLNYPAILNAGIGIRL